jgi:acid phosphatase type 7
VKGAAAIAIGLVALVAGGVSLASEKGEPGTGAVALPGGPAAAIPGPAAGRAVVWAVGDAATPGPGADSVARLVHSADVDLFLYLGDVYEAGTAGDFRRQYQPRYGYLAGITMPTIGNHEFGNRFSGYYPYWAGRKGHRQPPWSARTIAGWQILDLNSQAPHGTASPEVRWLERTLAGAPGDCRIAFMHRPRYSAGAYGGAPDLNPLWNRLAGHARVVLSGHDHNLQRHRAQKGIAQYVVGAGGRGRYSLHRGSSTLAWGRDDINGGLRMVLKPGRAVLEFRAPGGRVLDRSRVGCTPAGQ